MTSLEYSYIMVCVRTDELAVPSAAAVIRTCRECKIKVWYSLAGDPFYGQGLAQFECTHCITDRYHRGDIPTPELHEVTRQHLLSLGMSNSDIEDALFAMTVKLLGSKQPEGA